MEKPVDFYEIYEYYTPPLLNSPYVRAAIVIAFLLMVGLLIFLIVKRLKKKVMPWDWAQEQLKKLSPENCKNKKEFKKYYFSLTTTIKKYLNLRFFWQTEDKTDDELLELLQDQNFDAEQLINLRQILQNAVVIKFANEEALKSQAQIDQQTAFLIVEKTKPLDHVRKK